MHERKRCFNWFRVIYGAIQTECSQQNLVGSVVQCQLALGRSEYILVESRLDLGIGVLAVTDDTVVKLLSLGRAYGGFLLANRWNYVGKHGKLLLSICGYSFVALSCHVSLCGHTASLLFYALSLVSCPD